jgi:hypothetical protein
MNHENVKDEGIQSLWNTYEMKKGSRFYRKEFGYYCLDEWYKQGLSPQADLAQEFTYDVPAKSGLGHLGWVVAPFSPEFPEKILEDRGEHELIQDHAGRSVLMFKGRRSGFMPEYVDHPVKDMDSWERQCKWRLNPDTPERFSDLEQVKAKTREALAQGKMITQNLVGGYMYLRSLMGPEGVLYMVYDNPKLIHDCMETWFALSDKVIGEYQKFVTLDELFLAEDICYNMGPLISPDMMREFLFPYYQQLISNIKARQLDKSRHLYIQIDTDGNAVPVIPVYQEIGMDVMSPFEVASFCDVVEIGRQFPDLVILGGIDKRVLAEGKDAIDRHLDYILPVMSERGGYCPTCDHGVPEEVSLENYRHYRKRVLEY